MSPLAARILIACLLIPVAGTAGSALFVATEMLGRTPAFAEVGPLNLAEAVATRSIADVRRYLEEGQHATDEFTVRPWIISPSITRVTAAEGALWSREVDVIALLDSYGELRDGELRHEMACIGQAIGTADIVQYLSPGATPSCDGDPMRQIAARNTGR